MKVINLIEWSTKQHLTGRYRAIEEAVKASHCEHFQRLSKNLAVIVSLEKKNFKTKHSTIKNERQANDTSVQNKIR